jgi:hypothetical protein
MDTKKSTDFYFVAALLSLGARLENTDKTDPRHMEFEISLQRPEFKSENLQSGMNNSNEHIILGTHMDLEYYEKEWANETLYVNALRYKDAIQRLKSVIHSK